MVVPTRSDFYLEKRQIFGSGTNCWVISTDRRNTF